MLLKKQGHKKDSGGVCLVRIAVLLIFIYFLFLAVLPPLPPKKLLS